MLESMSAHFPKGDKIATLIFRGIIFCLGVLLLVILIKLWNKMGIRDGIVFCTLIGLFMGYGLGGDIWGARFFDLFTGMKSRAQVEKKQDALSKATLIVLVGILLALFSLFFFILYLLQRT